ncbi:MAG: hypothetical protein ACYC4H_14620 [Desulfocucumaceae bacterium]
MTVDPVQSGPFWQRQPGIAIKGYLSIYGLSIIFAWFLNQWLRAWPIGPDKIYWFDNVCWMLLSLWWCFLFAGVGNWPFKAIQNSFSRGIVATAACWVLGYFSYASVYWLGMTIDGVFPVIGTMYFLLVFITYTGENWLWNNLPADRQFFILLFTIIGLTYIIVHTSLRWIPPWWFPIAQMFLATGLGAYLFRNVKQPAKTIGIWAVWFVLVGIWILISVSMGIWDMKAESPSKFWAIGSYKDTWLLLFMVYCSFVWGVLVPLQNWPFRLVRMPWGGILASAFATVVTILVTLLLLGLVGPVFDDIYEAMTYGYMGVAWSFLITLFFGVGSEQPYLWAGQKAAGTWDVAE